MKYSIITAYNNNRTIGLNGEMPWHSKEDMDWFRTNTMSKPIIMGRKTWESLPETIRPLKNRINIVVSSTLPLPNKPTHHVFKTLREATHFAEKTIRSRKVRLIPEIMYIGGQSIYEQALSFCNKLYITEINNDVKGDTFFPVVDYTKYKCVFIDDENPLVTFRIFEKSLNNNNTMSIGKAA